MLVALPSAPLYQHYVATPTVCWQPCLTLKGMLAIKDLGGAYFIDRDPKAFAVILGFLQTGKVFLDYAGVFAEQVVIEADYFGLEGMIEILKRQQETIVAETGDHIL
jgi:hypothetical protein